MDLLKELAPGLVQINSKGGGVQVWSLGKIKKLQTCIQTGKVFSPAKGVVMYRPLSNDNNRYHRLSEEGLAQLRIEAASK